jgi:hypothetical protein
MSVCTLPMGAHVDHRGDSVVIRGNHGNWAASSGWMMRLVGCLFLICDWIRILNLVGHDEVP